MQASSGRQLPAALAACLAPGMKLAIAFSGGLDSRFLAWAARLAGCQVWLAHARGPHIPERESQWAMRWAASHNFDLHVFQFNPLALPEVAANSRQRCHGCKTALFAAMRREMAAKGDWLLCDGSQADDALGYRPGRQAALAAGVRSPLLEAGIGKADIRKYAVLTGLDWPAQQARPCLLTRLAYGLAPQQATLARLEACEAEIESALAQSGASHPDLRLRLRPQPLLQCSQPPGQAEGRIREILQAHGFGEAPILVETRLSGFFDRQGH